MKNLNELLNESLEDINESRANCFMARVEAFMNDSGKLDKFLRGMCSSAQFPELKSYVLKYHQETINDIYPSDYPYLTYNDFVEEDDMEYTIKMYMKSYDHNKEKMSSQYPDRDMYEKMLRAYYGIMRSLTRMGKSDHTAMYREAINYAKNFAADNDIMDLYSLWDMKFHDDLNLYEALEEIGWKDEKREAFATALFELFDNNMECICAGPEEEVKNYLKGMGGIIKTSAYELENGDIIALSIMNNFDGNEKKFMTALQKSCDKKYKLHPII